MKNKPTVKKEKKNKPIVSVKKEKKNKPTVKKEKKNKPIVKIERKNKLKVPKLKIHKPRIPKLKIHKPRIHKPRLPKLKIHKPKSKKVIQKVIPAKQKGKKVNPAKPKGKKVIPAKPKGKKVKPTKPIGKKVIPPKPKGKKVKPAKPIGKKVIPPKPKGKKVKPAKPIGKKVIPPKPKGKKHTKTMPKGNNYALRKKASQSSTWHRKYAASKAVDGVENTFTHTKNQKNAYWSVDLGKTVNVKQINIINRKDCCGHRLKNIVVTVGLNLNKMKHCSYFKGPGKNGQVIVLTCKTPISGRYVKILRSGKGILSLAEVQVIGHTGGKVIPAKPKGKKVIPAQPKGKKVVPAKPKGKKVTPAKPLGKKVKPAKLIGKKVTTSKPKGNNYALRKKASQSSTWHPKYAASKAVDGVENTFTHTKNQKNAYWSVDLGKIVNVKQINIINRKDCCGHRLKNIVVTVGLNLHKMKHCSNFKGPGKNGQVIVLTCKTPISGRYVKILRSGKGILSLAEVKVIGHTGKKVIPAKPKGKKVIPAKPKGKKVIPAKPKGKKVIPAKPKGQECRINLLGTNYGGSISKTKSGRTCQAWGSQTPQKHKLSKKLADQKNYCRNPDNMPHGPWCYTTDLNKRWEYCAIPYCEKKVTPAKQIRKKVKPAKPIEKKVKPAKPIEKKVKPAKPIDKNVKPAKPIRTNYALQGKASQSSTHSSRFAASKAIDGEENTFTHTKWQYYPYWSVDLGKTVSVEQIKITNRKNCCGKRLQNIEVTVGQNRHKMKHCSNFKGPGKNGQLVVLSCKTPISGRYVKILKRVKGILSLAEVQVIGHTGKKVKTAKPKGKKVIPAKPKGKKAIPVKPKGKKVKSTKPKCKKVILSRPKGKKVEPAKPKGINYALRRKASQSSTFHSKYAASQAVDGEENTFSATKKQNNAYWSVDLGKTVNVKQINIINRKDCCGHRLHNIAVTVGQNLNKMKHCSKFKGPGKNGQVIELTCKSPVAGRYVKILRSGKGILSLAEVQVIGHTEKKVIPAKPKGKKVEPAKPKGINYALRRKASQSSTFHSKYTASQAVDGEENTFSATKNQNNAYWSVDLGKTVNIKQINIINRKDCCGHRLHNIAVTVGLNLHKMKHCSKFKGPGKNGQVIELTCKTPIAGRYVKILRSGKGILSLAEVQVIGHTRKKFIPAKPKGTNYALQGKASQSSTQSSRHAASKAIDGVENTFTYTKWQYYPYWSVDLGKTVSVSQINIINRKNCCGRRLQNIAIEVTVGRNLHKMKHCSNFKGPGKKVLTCKTPISGRYVKISRRGKGILSLAEVQVLGHTEKKVTPAKPKGKKVKSTKPKGKKVIISRPKAKKVIPAKPNGTNYALQGKASQSSTQSSRHAASKAIDGVENTFTYTKWQYYPYWSVDLGKTVSVMQINIINRKNCCGRRLQNIAIEVTVGRNLHKMKHCSYFKGPGKKVLTCKTPISGRYVKISRRGKGILSLAEVQVLGHTEKKVTPAKPKGKKVKSTKPKGKKVILSRPKAKKVIPAKPNAKKVIPAKPNGTNYALQGKASQSSTQSSRHAASKAIDGVENTFTYTKWQYYPYWSVDLGKTVSVMQINIINRKNCCGRRLQNIAIEVTVGRNLHKMKHCSYFKGPGKKVLTCKTPISGRYVKISRRGKGILSLAEVQVLGHTEKKVTPAKPKGKKVKSTKPKGKKVIISRPKAKKVIPAKPNGTNYALQGKASQSSTQSSRHAASKAIDGVENTFTYTKWQYYPYWSVDLGKTVSVMQINIINRKNCCGRRLQNIAIEVTVGRNLHKMKHCSYFKGPGKKVLTCKTPISGRYVKISRRGKGILSLAEVQVLGHTGKEIRRTKRNVQELKRAKRSADDDLLLGEDLALGLGAKQSSWAKHVRYGDFNGVDGNTDTIVETKREQNPYWTIQLPKEEKIKGVVFINRVDCCGERFNNIQVMIGGKECATFKGPGENGEIISLRCSHPLTGKKVEVLLKGNGILSFAEIRIIAAEDADTEEILDKAFKKNLKPDDFYAVLEKDVKPSERKEDQTIGLKKVALRADGYTTEQISSLEGYTTDEKGVDGKIHTFVHTKKHLDPWWIVDLTKSYKVKKIKVLTRTTKRAGGVLFKQVTAFVGPDKENMKACGSFKGPAKESQLITFNCKRPVNGRYVKLQMKGFHYLIFAEVQVYAIY
ncbi:uncharacterized protein LOC134722967 [Mytilus trossulus]|uniref:uncharacterized protein LOC134722967 n=1 Tax=Mytilus trossulus TaxID=6551 RepID=UPI0030074DF5